MDINDLGIKKIAGASFIAGNEVLPDELLEAIVEELVSIQILIRDDDGNVHPNPDKVLDNSRLAFKFETDDDGEIISVEAISLADLPAEMKQQ